MSYVADALVYQFSAMNLLENIYFNLSLDFLYFGRREEEECVEGGFDVSGSQGSEGSEIGSN